MVNGRCIRVTTLDFRRRNACPKPRGLGGKPQRAGLSWALTLWVCMACAACGQLIPVNPLGLNVRAGFRVGVFAGPAMVHDIEAMAVDAQGNVVVAGDGFIKTLYDLNQDGVADRVVVFAEEGAGIQGLSFEGGRLYYVQGDGVYVLDDADGDGVADGPPSQFLALPASGGNGAHAWRRGPDGWWYTIGGGDSGFSPLPESSPYSPVRNPVAGALARVSTDGRTVQIIAHGFYDPYDFDFNGYGDIFVFDADEASDNLLPWYVPSRLFHVAVGRSHGYVASGIHSHGWSVPPYSPEAAVPVMTLGRSMPMGVETYRHYQFPEHFRDGVFVADWISGRVLFYGLEPGGVSYRAVPEIFLEAQGRNGFLPTDLTVGLDGALYVSTGGQRTLGSVYRLQFADPVFVGNATNWMQGSLTEFDAAMIAPQPQSAWSREIWVDILRRTPPEVISPLVIGGNYAVNLRMRGIEALTELYGGMDASIAAAAAQASEPEIRARVAWSLGREPCENCLPILLGLSRDTSAYVRVQALDALADRAADLGMAALQQAIAYNVGHTEKRVRMGVARLIEALTDPAWQALWPRLKSGTFQARLDGILGWIRRNREEPVHPEAVEAALEVFERSRNREERLEALRLILLGLGGTRGQEPTLQAYAAYEPAVALENHAPLTQKVRNALNPTFPTRIPLVDFELARVLALVGTTDSNMLERILSLIDARTPATSDMHYLIVLSRMPGARSTNATARTAQALLSMEAKLGREATAPNQNWPVTLLSVAKELMQKDPHLAQALVYHPALTFSTHAALFPLLGSEHFLTAVRRFLGEARQNTGLVWTVPLVQMLSTMPSEDVVPLFRRQWPHGELRPGLAAKFAEKPAAIDRDKFLWALESSDGSLVRMGLKALQALPAEASGETLLSAMRCLRRWLQEPSEGNMRAQILALVNHEAGTNFSITEQGGRTASVAALYQPVFDWFARSKTAWHARLDERDRASDRAWELKLNSVRWTEGDPISGRIIYAERGCRRCHFGYSPLGPALQGLDAGRTPKALIEEVIFPNRHVAESFRSTVVGMRDGSTLTGAVVFESPDVVLLQDVRGFTNRLAVEDIASRHQSDVSFMPPGLLDDLTVQGLADLHAFLRTL